VKGWRARRGAVVTAPFESAHQHLGNTPHEVKFKSRASCKERLKAQRMRGSRDAIASGMSLVAWRGLTVGTVPEMPIASRALGEDLQQISATSLHTLYRRTRICVRMRAADMNMHCRGCYRSNGTHSQAEPYMYASVYMQAASLHLAMSACAMEAAR
jgi:hypothetical protein